MPNALLHIPVRCPESPQRCAECAEFVRQRLLHRAGVSSATIERGESDARIALDYDPNQITLTDLEREVRLGGGCFADERGHAVIPVSGMVSPQSEQLIETVLNRLPGVVAAASYASSLVRVEFDPHRCMVPEILTKLAQLGYGVRDASNRGDVDNRFARNRATRHAERRSWTASILYWLSNNPELAFPLLGGCFLLAAFATRAVGGSPWIRTCALLLSFACSSRFTGIETLRTIARLRFDVEVLMFVAAAGAAVLGNFEEGALLLVLFGLGTAGEKLAMDRARRAIKALAELAPETAIVCDASGREREVRVSELHVGDRVIVRPGERVPADGDVVSGASTIDQSPITGESMPVDKAVGSSVFAGTINGSGALMMEVRRRSDETKLAKIVKLVAEAQTTKSPTQVLTDRVERYYVPFVLSSTMLLIALPPLASGAWAEWFYRAMAFLTAASPCALAIGTPAAVLSGIARAARGGVLIKGGVHLENLSRVRAIAFDKTGTLTRGRAEVTDVVSLDERLPNAVLGAAAAVEQASTHPLATAIVAEAAARNLTPARASDVRELCGVGIIGSVGGRTIGVSQPKAIPQQASTGAMREAVTLLQSQGRTAIVVTENDRPIGVIALADHPRPGAAEVVATLRKMGIQRTIMLTGDNERVAEAVAKQLGLDEYYAELLPEDKVTKLRELSEQVGGVAMVGDGVNDAPALATATVGIAMGGAGTDVALETADVALMADDLAKLPEAIELSRFSRRIILQNLVIALGVIAIMAPTAALGGASLGIAVVFHEGSTVLVVLNALRLLTYRPRKDESTRST